MKTRLAQLAFLFSLVVIALLVMAAAGKNAGTVEGYVIDSACTYVKNLDKPISGECARACAKAGSPLVILAGDGKIYWPIDDAMPAKSQNEKLLPYAGERVEVTGKVFNRGGSRAIVIESVRPVKTT
ncbi:MAG: hypothetical protein L0Z53_17305 [Acidobacteriales bacterium]|nr:hypothetical protein [Terriglobales bacterium]